ncbi:MAG: ASCH domain-containing protein [Firmicutes bacterium]|nr:ASCH domain-containing protein [Bacillota bacterium]
MKAITLYQPWATLVALGAKKIETRSWATKYRGPLAIHAGKTIDKVNCLKTEIVIPLNEHGYVLINDLPTGAVIATCNLVDCIEMTDDFLRRIVSSQEYELGHYEIGRYAWLFENIEPLPEPVPARGRQRLWEWRPPEGVVIDG